MCLEKEVLASEVERLKGLCDTLDSHLDKYHIGKMVLEREISDLKILNERSQQREESLQEKINILERDLNKEILTDENEMLKRRCTDLELSVDHYRKAHAVDAYRISALERDKDIHIGRDPDYLTFNWAGRSSERLSRGELLEVINILYQSSTVWKRFTK